MHRAFRAWKQGLMALMKERLRKKASPAAFFARKARLVTDVAHIARSASHLADETPATTPL